jgi:hypothetical protein
MNEYALNIGIDTIRTWKNRGITSDFFLSARITSLLIGSVIERKYHKNKFTLDGFFRFWAASPPLSDILSRNFIGCFCVGSRDQKCGED